MGTDGKALRVALLSGFPANAANIRNGVQAATTYLLKGLARIDCLEVHFLTFRSTGWVGPDCYDQNGVCVHLMPQYPRFERLRDYRVYQKLLNEKLPQIRPDIVHAQGASSDALVALRSGYPTVITAHGIRREEQKYYRDWGERIRGYYDSVITEQRVVGRTRYLIAISHYMMQYFAARFHPDIRYFFIPNAVDEVFFSLGSSERYTEVGEAPYSPVILYAGRVTPLKRVIDLVQAFALVLSQVPTAQLHIAGECSLDPVYSESIRTWIYQAGLGEYIQLLGALDQEAILREYDRCNIFVLPSAQENSPMVIAQAMAAGKPVVATRVGGIAEMIGTDDERGLLVQVGDINGLANSVLRLLQNQALMSQMSHAGRAFALENYYMDRVAQRTYEVYQNIVKAEHDNHG